MATEIQYHMLHSTDGGLTWLHDGTQGALTTASALGRMYPERIVGHQYVAVAPTHWQPLEQAVREVPYTRRVTGLHPVEQLVIEQDIPVEETDAESQAANAALQASVAEELATPPPGPLSDADIDPVDEEPCFPETAQLPTGEEVTAP